MELWPSKQVHLKLTKDLMRSFKDWSQKRALKVEFRLCLICFCLYSCVPVVKNLESNDPVAGGGYDVGEGHQRVSSFLHRHTNNAVR